MPEPVKNPRMIERGAIGYGIAKDKQGKPFMVSIIMREPGKRPAAINISPDDALLMAQGIAELAAQIKQGVGVPVLLTPTGQPPKEERH